MNGTCLAYYNEIDPYAAQWLRNLIAAGHIALGDVDERSIEDVRPEELTKYTQCHFFAGIGVWSYALRKAGWQDGRKVWTGSCPCQPFSAAGKGKGVADERHLWPAFFHLIRECCPDTVIGEQVASKDGLGWLDLVQADLEGAGYASGAVDLCAAGVGAPHLRQRLWFVAERLADSKCKNKLRASGGGREGVESGAFWRLPGSDSGSALGGMGDPSDPRLQKQQRNSRDSCETSQAESGQAIERTGASTSRMAYPNKKRCDSGCQSTKQKEGPGAGVNCCIENGGPGPTNGFWRDTDWLFCRDGKWRPVEPGTFPLAHGVTNRVGRLRAYGNAINAEVATEFIAAYLDA